MLGEEAEGWNGARAKRRSAQAQRGRLGRPLAPRQGSALSVLRRCFTDQTGDMVYTLSEIEWLSQFWLYA
jgi:hypothetical protein